MSTMSKASRRMDEASEFVERGIYVLFLGAVFVALACLVILIGAFTFGVLHNGNDFDFGEGARGGEGDTIVLPALPF
jgi:hypothetical protein